MDILTPLVYCELRSQQGEECDTFSSRRVEGLACCANCADRLVKALDDAGVTLVKEVKRGKNG